MGGLGLTGELGGTAQAAQNRAIVRGEVIKDVQLLLAEPPGKSPYTQGDEKDNQHGEPCPQVRKSASGQETGGVKYGVGELRWEN